MNTTASGGAVTSLAGAAGRFPGVLFQSTAYTLASWTGLLSGVVNSNNR
jgi:hypothetical protein